MKNLTTSSTRIDDNDVLFFAEELTHYDPREFDTIKSGLSFLDTFHSNTSIDRGQETYSYNVYTKGAKKKRVKMGLKAA